MKLFLHIPWFILKDDAIFALALRNNGSGGGNNLNFKLVSLPVSAQKLEGAQSRKYMVR